MSEILTKHGRIIERLSMYNKTRFDRVSWPCHGHECPSYIRSFRHRTQNLTHLQHVSKSKRSYRLFPFNTPSNTETHASKKNTPVDTLHKIRIRKSFFESVIDVIQDRR